MANFSLNVLDIRKVCDRFCGLVVSVPGYWSRGSGSIPCATKFLQRSPLSLVSTIEELPERKNSGSLLENQEYGRRTPSRWPRGNLYLQKLALTSPIIGGHSIGIIRSRTQAIEFILGKCTHFRTLCILEGHLKESFQEGADININIIFIVVVIVMTIVLAVLK
jgi:hypothetical protein